MDMKPLNALREVISKKLSSIYFNHEWRISDFYENNVIRLFLSDVDCLFFWADLSWTEQCVTILVMKSFESHKPVH